MGLGGAWNFLKRHRIKFVIAVGGVTALYVYYALRKKYLHITQVLEEERENASNRLQDGFGASLKQAHVLLRKMIPELQAAIFKMANSDKLVINLRSAQTSENKKALWEQLKIESFVRTITSVYATCLLELVLVTKFNLVGRYVSNETTMNELPTGFLRKHTQHSYITLARRSLLGPCLEDLVRTVHEAVTDELGKVELTKTVSGADLTLAIMRIRKRVETHNRAALRKILVDSCSGPEVTMENWGDGENLVALLAAEADILDNNDAATVLGDIVEAAFESFEELLYNSLDDKSLPLPKCLPKIANLASKVLSEDSTVVSAVESTPLVTQFGAVVYLSGEPEGS